MLGTRFKTGIIGRDEVQDWQDRIFTAQNLNNYAEQLLNPSSLCRIPENMRLIQKQVGYLFARILDKNGANGSVKMAAYCGENGVLVFQFAPLAVRFEYLGNQVFTNILSVAEIMALRITPFKPRT